MEAGAFGAGKAGTAFNPVEFVQRPQVILRLLNIAGSSYFAYQRYRQGADSAFATAYETGMGGPGGATTPGSAGGYTSFPGMGTTADPIGGGPGGYQGPPFSQGPRPASGRKRTYSSVSNDAEDHFYVINERPVDDISLDFFYKPHTITLLTALSSVLLYSAFTRNDDDFRENVWAGVRCVIFIFLVISVLAFPNGPFTRPHPAVWRMVFGLSVLYLMALQFFLFQNYQSVRSILVWTDPSLENFHIDMDKEYGVNCSDISLERIWGHVDVFAASHFFGWIMKALLVRHYGILWTISVMWEITEIAFAHLLPNFVECWWDAIILDILLCNGLGIWVGMKLCHYLEMREYKWESIKELHSTSDKIKRAVLQFTPESWTHVRWLDPHSSYMRFLAVCQLVVFWQITELNTFFLKHIFELPPSHMLNLWRLVVVGLIVAPSVRQYYTYVTDARCTRVGTQCWVFGAILFTEMIICIKFGKDIFEHTQILTIAIWLGIQSIMSMICLYGCVLYHRRDGKKSKRRPKLPKLRRANEITTLNYSNTNLVEILLQP
uniref:Phosphatidylserine synthase n=1 Tax=Ceriodaphnia reticulata TaxID=302197 RepID=A0A4Y7LTI0_9CRUS|nr:EOG090X05CZ [Ceriodaphnia reticulata]SVE72908.1 EOG090X05CZ [Ceriodaphnia reticulata]